MAIGCNAQENMFKLSYLMLQKNFPVGSLGGHVPQCPIYLATPLFGKLVKTSKDVLCQFKLLFSFDFPL
jgi:hypothetical protein